MELLIDDLEDAAAWFRGRKESLRRLDAQYRKAADRDIKKEMASIRRQMRKKAAEVGDELMARLDELRYLKKYFPDLLQAFLDDPEVGPLLSKKAWLLDYRPMAPQDAALRLEELKRWRAQLRDAGKFLRGWVGSVDARAFSATYPLLRGYLHGDMDKADVLAAIKEADGVLRRQGWLLLLTPSLIEVPLMKFMNLFNKASHDVSAARSGCRGMEGRGTIAETTALKALREAARRKAHYERVIRQVLMASPEYLPSLRKKDWLSRGRQTTLQRMAQTVTPRTVKEMAWLGGMRKRLEAERK